MQRRLHFQGGEIVPPRPERKQERLCGMARSKGVATTRSIPAAETEPRNLREVQQRATREKLIQATFRAFSEQRFHDATINDIARIAGTSRATFYLHFASKSEALSAAWAELEQPRMIRYWRRLDSTAPWTRDSIRAWIDSILGVWEKTRKFSIASNEAVSIDAEMGQRWFEGIVAYLDHVPNVMQRLARDNEYPQHRFVLLCTQMDRSVYMYLTGNFPGTRGQFVAALAGFWCDALLD